MRKVMVVRDIEFFGGEGVGCDAFIKEVKRMRESYVGRSEG